MRTTAHRLLLVALSIALTPALGIADIASDRAAAIVVFPDVDVFTERFEEPDLVIRERTDTVIQLSNTSNETVRAWCFYVSALGECSISGDACFDGSDCPNSFEFCVPRWVETDFDVVLTPRQPLAWTAGRGLPRELLPLDGNNFVGPTGESNAGTAIPPVDTAPIFDDDLTFVSGEAFFGELRCIVVDDAGRGIPRNVLKGEATNTTQFERLDSEEEPFEIIRAPSAAKYNAIGIQAIDGDANDDGILELGGEANEYNGCSEVLIAQHYFDFSFPTPGPPVFSGLTLVPCTADYRTQTPGSTNIQFLVFNEFEQRFSTSVRFDCFFFSPLAFIDTNQPERSIWFVGVAGTIAGQTRIRGVQTGLLGVLSQQHFGDFPDSFIHLGLQGERGQPDRMILPR